MAMVEAQEAATAALTTTKAPEIEAHVERRSDGCDEATGDEDAVDSQRKTTKSKKKKKKSAKKKKKGTATASVGSKAPPFRGVSGFTDSYVAVGQTDPPTIPIEELYADGQYPEGEIQAHPGDFNTFRTTSEEKRALDRAQEDLYATVRHAAEVHRHVRKFAQSIIKPGVKLIDMCTQLENKNRELVVEAGFAVRVVVLLQ